MRSSDDLLRIVIGLALALLSVALLLLSMPPYGLWPLAIFGWIPMLVAQHRAMPPKLSSLASAITVGGFIGGFFATIYGSKFFETGFMVFLPLIVAAIVFVADLGTLALHARTGYRCFVAHGALIWVGIEMIRNLIPFLGTGGFIGYAFFRAPALIQPVSIFGMFGLDLLIMLLAYTLGLGAIWLYDRWQRTPAIISGKTLRGWLIGAGAAALLWTVASLLMFNTVQGGPAIRVAAIQPNDSSLATYTDLTREAAAQGAQLVVWPEGALAFDPRRQHRDELVGLARETGVHLVTGYTYLVPEGRVNEATMITPQGEILEAYGKAHPLTLLGETSPTRGSFPAYATPFATVGPIICYDMTFNDVPRILARQGVQMVAAPSNDWPELYNMEYAHLVFRAVENRVAMVKADYAFDSVVIDAYGRVVAMHASSTPSQYVLLADVSPGPLGALQSRWGDWIGWASLTGMAFFVLPNPLLKSKKAAALKPDVAAG